MRTMDDLIKAAYKAFAEEQEQGWIGKTADDSKPLNDRAHCYNGELVWPAETEDDLAIYFIPGKRPRTGYYSVVGRIKNDVGRIKNDVGRIPAGTVCSVTLPFDF